MEKEKIEKIVDILLSAAINIKEEIGPKRISPRRKLKISKALVSRLIVLERAGIGGRKHKRYINGLKDLIELLGERLMHRCMRQAKNYVTENPDVDFSSETIEAMEDKFLDMVFSGVYNSDAPKRKQLINMSERRAVRNIQRAVVEANEEEKTFLINKVDNQSEY